MHIEGKKEMKIKLRNTKIKHHRKPGPSKKEET